MADEHGLTPGVLGLIAVLSIGGLLFVGWQASIVGKAVEGSYVACCTAQDWRVAPTGFIYGSAATNTESCSDFETPGECCQRASAARSIYPVRVLGSKRGSCTPLEVNYPATFSGHAVCCTLETWQNTAVGWTQSTAKTTTEFCGELETASLCCLRRGELRYEYPVKLLGFREGACEPTVPEKSYPIWVR